MEGIFDDEGYLYHQREKGNCKINSKSPLTCSRGFCYGIYQVLESYRNYSCLGNMKL